MGTKKKKTEKKAKDKEHEVITIPNEIEIRPYHFNGSDGDIRLRAIRRPTVIRTLDEEKKNPYISDAEIKLDSLKETGKKSTKETIPSEMFFIMENRVVSRDIDWQVDVWAKGIEFSEGFSWKYIEFLISYFKTKLEVLKTWDKSIDRKMALKTDYGIAYQKHLPLLLHCTKASFGYFFRRLKTQEIFCKGKIADFKDRFYIFESYTNVKGKTVWDDNSWYEIARFKYARDYMEYLVKEFEGMLELRKKIYSGELKLK